MASSFRKLALLIGLAEPTDEELSEAAEPGRVKPAQSFHRGRDELDELDEYDRYDEPVEAVVRPIPSAMPGKVHLVEPTGFNDAEEIGERFKSDIPVILNLQAMDNDVSKRLIDFAAGLTFGLDGRIQRVADKVFLLTPRNIEVSAEERQRLQERGFFNQS